MSIFFGSGKNRLVKQIIISEKNTYLHFKNGLKHINKNRHFTNELQFLTIKINIMRVIITITLLLCISSSFSQWTRVTQLPPTFIASLYHKDNILYAGGTNIIYISRDKGLTWDSTSTIPQFMLVTSIIGIYQIRISGSLFLPALCFILTTFLYFSSC